MGRGKPRPLPLPCAEGKEKVVLLSPGPQQAPSQGAKAWRKRLLPLTPNCARQRLVPALPSPTFHWLNPDGRLAGEPPSSLQAE